MDGFINCFPTSKSGDNLTMFKGLIILTWGPNTILTLGVLNGLRREFPFFLLRTPHRGGQLSNLRPHIIYNRSKFNVS